MFRIDLYFSLWIYFWYILYNYNYIPFNPLFALIFAFLIGYVLFIIPMIQNKVSFSYLFYFSMIALIIKVIPIYKIYNNELKPNDILFTFTLFIIYLLYIKKLNHSFYGYYNYLLNTIIEEDKKNNNFFCLYYII